MPKRIVFILGVAAIFVFMGLNLGLSQGETPAAQTETLPETLVPPESEPQTQWLWGEVISCDPNNKELVIKYPDYESDQEKEMAFMVDAKTNFENVKSLEEIKVKDAVSIDYVAGADGKNTAKNISVEKSELPALETPQATTPEAAPVEAQAPADTQGAPPQAKP